MATYKIIQDIEADDHILGPLSLRQFIYALISLFLLYISFILFSKGVGFMAIITLPPALFTGFFAFPFGRDQPTELWALAKIRFFILPHKRIWNQSGVKELVTITAPKKVEVIRTNGLDQTEVKSRLQALANTIDSRGWAIKNVNVNLYEQPGQIDTASDRLVNVSTMPQAVPDTDVQASDDILDAQSNPIAHQLDQLITASTVSHHQDLVNELNSSLPSQQSPAVPAWFTPGHPVASAAPVQSPVVTANGSVPFAQSQLPSSTDEAILDRGLEQNHSQQVSYAHLRTVAPLGSVPPQIAMPPATPQDVPAMSTSTDDPSSLPIPNPAILSLANNNDLNISTLAREAHKSETGADHEVVISLR